MTELERKALLPDGLRDVLPPVAGFEARVIEKLVDHFSANGYARVKAPLVEFEDGLFSGAGAAMTAHTFRLMDPVSQRMMGVRADITPQMARIASTRLRDAPRPLRLSYAGEVLRIRGTQLRPERQFPQVGVELIGSEAATADAEIIAMAVDALAAVGVADVSVDITVPPLVSAICDGLGLDAEVRARLRAALDRKDAAAVHDLGGAAAELLGTLLTAAGPADACFAILAGLDLPDGAARERARIGEVLDGLRKAGAVMGLTLDPVENRGFEYHTGISFTIFPTDVRGELGAGGRYISTVNGAGRENGGGESATGFTLFLDTILRALPEPEAGGGVFVPVSTPSEKSRALRAEGWVTIAGLDEVDDEVAEARRLGCAHVLIGNDVRPVEQVK